MPWPFNAKPAVFRAPEPPQVLGRSDLPPCPPRLIAQTEWLARNMARVRLGTSKLQVVGIVGDPAHAETFSLQNGAVVEVLFYHTPETVCRVAARSGELMPLVFQDDRLLGYGPNYYRDFIVPMMRPKSVERPAGAATGGLPEQRVEMYSAPSLRPAPARMGRLVQEDLPKPNNTHPQAIYEGGTAENGRGGYSGAMQDVDSSGAYYGTGYRDERSLPRTRLGRGEPL